MRPIGKWMITAACLLTTLAGTAQQVHIGLRGGATFNTVRATELLESAAPNFDFFVGYQTTAFAEIPVSKGFFVQPEVSFTQKGFRFAEGMDVDLFGLPLPVGVQANTVFNYLEAPMLGRINLGNEQIQAYLVAGPAFGYATGGEVRTRTTGLVELDLADIRVDLDAIGANRFEVSGIVGAGVALSVGTGKIQVDARYQHGFSQLYDIPMVTEGLRNQGFSLSAGYAIPIGR